MKKGWQTKPFEECIDKVTYTPKVQRKDFLDDGTYPIISQEDDFILDETPTCKECLQVQSEGSREATIR